MINKESFGFLFKEAEQLQNQIEKKERKEKMSSIYYLQCEDVLTIVMKEWGRFVTNVELLSVNNRVAMDVHMTADVLEELVEFANEEVENHIFNLVIEEREDINATEIWMKDDYYYTLNIVIHMD